MTSLSDPVLLGNTDPSQDTIKSWTISGGHDVIQEKLGETGWDGRTQVASIGLYQDDQGKIVDSQIFLSGFRAVGHISAKMIWGDKLNNDDYIKMNPMDTAQANIRGRMVSDWIASDKEDWVLKIINPETKRYRVVDKLAEDSLKEKGASKMAFRYHLALSKGPSLITKLGVAPTGDIEHTVGQGSMNFPMIGLGGEAKVEILPGEPARQGWGLGFTPFIIKMGDAEAPTPTIEDIRGAIEDMLNNACKPQMKKTFKTWKDCVAKGGWDPVDPTYLWPSRTGQAAEDSEEDASDGELMGPCESSEEEDASANVTAVDPAVSTEELINRARRAGNMNNDKDRDPTARPKKPTSSGRPEKTSKRKAAEVDLTKDAESLPKIPKKLNSVMFPKEVRPDWLLDDEAIDELTRAEALQSISQWNMTKAMMKQNDLTEERNRKSKGSLKKDQEIKKITIEEGEDDATTVLHSQRFSFRTPLKKPEEYWSLVPSKWPEVNKKIHLAHLGLDHVISAKTIEIVHDKSDTNIDIKKFSNVNVMIGREGSQKSSKIHQNGDSIELETQDTWLEVASMWQLEEALDNLVRLWTAVWPGDYGPANLRGVVTRHRAFKDSFENVDTRKKVTEDFINKVLQDNAIKAGQGLPPLNFDEVDKRAKEIVERKADLMKMPKPRNTSTPDRPSLTASKSSSQHIEFQAVRSETQGLKWKGQSLCAWYNTSAGCQHNRCRHAHVCAKVLSGQTEPCGEKHSKDSCRK